MLRAVQRSPPAWSGTLARMNASVHEAASAALMLADPESKCTAARRLWEDFQAGRLVVVSGEDAAAPLPVPGRPERPLLVAPHELHTRRVGSREGHAALLHAIAHIEFNAINLALDCVCRFRNMPADFHRDWACVAAEEALHFGLVRDRLATLGCRYGDFPAHDGLWDMARKTAHDPLARMALVPRVLEARGLDATPVIMRKLAAIGDRASIGVLEVILRDEVGHVAIGDRWFRHLCAARGLDPEATYAGLLEAFDAPRPQPPLNEAARLAAGFSRSELDALSRRVPPEA